MRDNAGNPIVVTYYDTVGSGNGTLIPQSARYYTYDAQNRLIRDSIYHYSKSVWAYVNNVATVTGFSWSGAANDWVLSGKSVYSYNASNKLDSMVFYSWNQSLGSYRYNAKVIYEYNGLGFLSTERDFSFGWNDQWYTIVIDSFGYVGNNPVYNYHASFEPNSTTGILEGTWKYIYHLNSAGAWDTTYEYLWNHNTLDWMVIYKTPILYNNYGLVSQRLPYHVTPLGQFELTPSDTINYYYEEYTPTAVTILKAPSVEITAYPNPVSGKLHIDGNIGSKNVSMQLISFNGQRLFNASGNWQSMNKDINMSALASGVYYLLITDHEGNKIAAKQIVKN